MKSYSHSLPINEKIADRYRIQGVLGEGGFGITYRAWDEHLERLVVIKEYLPGELGVRDGATLSVLPRTRREEDFHFGLKRYLDEAKALAKFQHPNIVRIIDHLEANGTAYIMMEYEEGETLAERLRRLNGKMGEEEILDLSLSLLQGLREVHKAGLLHRDIKPGNIFLRKSGGPLLIDFGAARHALGEHSKNLSAIVSGGYAPPEQYSVRGKQGPYTDLYAIGAVLYELITGKTPLESVERSHQIGEGEPDPLAPASQEGQGQFSAWLLQLNDWLLRVPSKERPQACEEVLTEIRSHRVSTDLSPRQMEPDRPVPQGTRVVTEEERFRDRRIEAVGRWYQGRERGLWAVGGAVALVVLGILGFLMRGGQKPPQIAADPAEPQVSQLAAISIGSGSVEPVPPSPPTAPNEGELFSIASQIDTTFGYQLFLRKHPQGAFSAEARRRFNGN